MSGIFNRTDRNKTQSGPSSLSTPTRRGFYLSPSQQDISSAEKSYSMGFRSPHSMYGGGGAGFMSPSAHTQGRSLKEYEDQMTNLKKENFNLKLRIYFIEEKHASNMTDEATHKQNIDLKVENESLRKELQDKQELLCQAHKAMEAMEQQHKEQIDKYQMLVDELHQKVEMSENEIKDLQAALDESNRMQASTDGFAEFLGVIDAKDVDNQQKVKELEVVMQNFSEQNEQLCEKIEHMEAEKVEMVRKYNDIAYENAEIRERLEENNRFLRGKELNKIQEESYEMKRRLADAIYQLDVTEKKLNEKSKSHEKSLQVIQKACDRIEDLELQIELLKSSQPNSLSSTESAKNDEIFTQVNTKILSLQKQIEQITREKNDEINRLKEELKNQSQYFKETCCSNIELTHNSSLSMFVPTNEMRFNEIIEKYRNAQKRINYLKQKILSSRDGLVKRESEVLQMKLKEAQVEADETETLMRQSAIFCGMLIERLDELARFLSSLLQKKDIISNMGADLRLAICRAVDASLDISRNFNISHSPCSERERSCSHISLTELDLVENSGASSPSLVNEKSVAHSFTSELQKLRGELELSRNSKTANSSQNKSVKSKSAKKPSSLLNQCSDSEEWSEPDRDVSMARIGIKTDDPTNFIKRSTTTSEEEEINLLTGESGDHKIFKKMDWNAINQRIGNFEKLLSEKNSDSYLDNEFMAMKSTKDELGHLKDSLHQSDKDLNSYKHLYKKLERETHEFEDKLNALTCSLNERNNQIKTLKDEKDSLNHELHAIQSKYEDQLKDIDELQKRCRECETDLEIKSREFEKKENEFKNELQLNWIKKSTYNQLLTEFEKKQEKFVEANQMREELEEEILRLKNILKNKENMIVAVNRNLDSTSLQLSVASVERARALNDKRSLENQMKKLNDLNQELSNDKQELNLKIAELEEFNARLQNKLLVGDKPFFLHQPVSSDASGYASEETGGMGLAGRYPSISSIDEKGKERENRLLLPLLKTRSEHRILLDSGVDSDCSTCKKLYAENVDLKKSLSQSKRSLEQAYAKLRAQNVRKAQIEKDIKQQILKTQNVLQNVRTNMENELSKNPVVSKTE